MRGSKIFRILSVMVKILGLEAEGGYEGRGKKFPCGGIWRGRNFFEFLRGGIWRGRNFFWGSLEGGDGGGQKGFSLRGEKKFSPAGG